MSWVLGGLILLIGFDSVQAQVQLNAVSFARRSDDKGYVIRLHLDQEIARNLVRVIRPEVETLDVMLANVVVSDTVRNFPAIGPVSHYFIEQRPLNVLVRFSLRTDVPLDIVSYPDGPSNDHLVALTFAGPVPPDLAEATEENSPIANVPDTGVDESPEIEQEEELEPDEGGDTSQVQRPPVTQPPPPPDLETTTPGQTTARPERLPNQRQMRGFIPPDQIVSFLASTPFPQFIAAINPIFIEQTGKQVIDLENRSFPIGIDLVGQHFFDAFDQVLYQHGLTFRETDRYLIVELAPQPITVGATVPTGTAGTGPGTSAATGAAVAATAQTREILIEAVLFDINVTKAKEKGLNWNVFLSDEASSSGSSGGSSGGISGAGQEDKPEFTVRTGDLWSSIFGDRVSGPSVLKGSTLAQFFRFVEEEGIGETVARPSITVRSGLTGNIQIGSDFPIVVRDFSGNSITNFISTGIIIDVTPTVIVDAVADTAGAPLIEFIHLDAKVERSSGRPFNSSVAVDRSGADTEILLLDNEATIIGGLFSTDETQTRRGIPILKDLPGWFFGLRYIFGTDNTTYNQRELLIVLRARILDPLSVRAQRALPVDLRNRYRDRLIETLENFDQEKADEFPLRPRNQ